MRMRTSNFQFPTSNIERRESAAAISGLRSWMLNVGCWMFSVSFVVAESDLLTEARRAVAESVPQIAVRKIEALRAKGDLSASDRDAATLLIAEALLDARKGAEALREVETLSAAANPEALLLHAHILAASGRWAEALPAYEQLAGSSNAPAAAKLGLAESLHATGRTAEAIEIFESFVQANPRATTAHLRLAGLLAEAGRGESAGAALAAAQPETPGDLLCKSYIGGRLLLLENKPAAAAAVFEEVTKSDGNLSENLLFAATLGLLDARIALSGNEVADGVLESFISKYPESAWLEPAFQRLDQVYAAEKSPPENELKKWATAPERRRAALARYFVARMQMRSHKLDRAAASIDAFIGSFPDHPLLPQVHIMRSDVHLARRQFPEAVRALEAAERDAKTEALRAEIELRTGLVHYQQGEYLLAANKFESAGRRLPSLRETAAFDLALAALNQKNFERFEEQYREVRPDGGLRADLLLEEGLLQARTGDPRAEDTLRLFLIHFATHRRAPEARLALAEIAFAGGNPTAAAHYLRAANDAPRTTQTDEHSEYLAIFLEEAKTPRDDAKVVEIARRFLVKYPASVLLAEVRMKLGEVYFRNEDYANAETQFATLSKENPASPYAENALFLAGQSAMKTINPGAIDRALGLFDQVVKRDGPFKLYARQQQAIVQSGRDEAEAVKLYDIILAAQPPPELRHAALCAKGNSLATLGRTEPGQLEAAIAVYDELAASDAPPAWRNQALYKKAAALEKLGRGPEALTAYYDVLARSSAEDREYLWYYKAGFDAARIFEAAKEWKSAIGIYEKMAAIDGPRSGEARARVKRLRLEYFIWP